jgi:hypothetical protein
MSTNSIFIKLTPPAVLYALTDDIGDDVTIIAGHVGSVSFPPFPAAADILSNDRTHEFGGIVYQVGSSHRQALKDAVASLDSRCIRYIDRLNRRERPMYEKEPDTIDFLEIVWSDPLPNVIIPAQLSQDYWFYSESETGLGERNHGVLGVGINDLPVLLHDFGLSQWSRSVLATNPK